MSTLQDLRKEAGFRTAKDFAESVGIPAPTYTRYEQDPMKIPIERAWAIADELHCSIDAVVGRDHIDVADMRGDFQKLIETFSPDDQRLMWSIASAVKERADEKERQRQQEEDRKYDQYASYYERLLEQEADGDPDLADSVIFGSPAQRRKAFQTFITDRAKAKREADIEDEVAQIQMDLDMGAGFYLGSEEDGEPAEFISCDDPRYDKETEGMVEKVRESRTREFEERDATTIAKIMAGYDRIHPAGTSYVAPELARKLRNLLAHYSSVRLSDLDSASLSNLEKLIAPETLATSLDQILSNPPRR